HGGPPDLHPFPTRRSSDLSPMGAAILRHLAGQRVYVESAGIRAGERDPFAEAVMNEIGIDLTRHKPQALGDLHDTTFDLIITLSDRKSTRLNSSHVKISYA